MIKTEWIPRDKYIKADKFGKILISKIRVFQILFSNNLICYGVHSFVIYLPTEEIWCCSFVLKFFLHLSVDAFAYDWSALNNCISLDSSYMYNYLIDRVI